MSKKFSKDWNEDFDSDYRENGYHDMMTERRKNKRMRNAIKSKNLDDLLDLDDEYY